MIARLPGLLAGVLVFAQAVAAGPTETAEPPQSADFENLKREWSDAMQALKSYSAAQRDTALARAQEMLDTMDERIDRLEARAQQQWTELGEDARDSREQSLRALRRQRNEVAQWYGGMKHGSATAWESVKEGFVESYAVLGDAFREAWSALDDNPDGGP